MPLQNKQAMLHKYKLFLEMWVKVLANPVIKQIPDFKHKSTKALGRGKINQYLQPQ